ncbi:UDP-2,4-diacetamido-2,4,6-trideoxy-beta-L-altropyranose hydrolase [Pseudomonas sp. 148P]|uniref:UDP-2,4-diacetamido-2,4, 6-trideoxy-beta-L-altropyranose hydrolase n=1 Tax=Pseudomonas ulcerans TaxID=3115852 RepID=A0ABU7HX97_9PSED|nr:MULTISPECIES: UDP-2,4-diacetamido-2,4,6-trideoxy-beta-L-altropyranose hydrolase [unclassified Pseudomonas]MEE1920389.1 UDP-2,4-diacetamido-2,4,6-trideoxy-beta-L-altropyranose hydrolase [Pseudomonas sp. 147P]MEE1936180.1 UDP-2,4-diacetamido-2,4,6-trideoxy-beta-L-altropyranose hydrolase [Pseudomonas sp. 148P]
MKVLVRADASSQIGIGHVMRCLTLARHLAASGAEVAFACRELPGHQLARIAEAGHEVFVLPAQGDEQVVLDALLPGPGSFDWIIVDHYGFDAAWEKAARRWARWIMAIDDLADRPHACDLLLDQNYTASVAAYRVLVPEACQILAGPRYALLGEAFRQARAPGADDSRRVLVSFGGFDQAGMTLKTLQALDGIDAVQVQCIAGQATPDFAALQALVARRQGWELQAFVHDLPGRMANAALFVGAGGGTTWERAAMGLPSICVSVADNQVGNAQALARDGMHLYLGSAQEVTLAGLRQAIVGLLSDAALRQQFAARSQRLVDGLGVQRVESHFQRLLKDVQHEQF